MGSELVSKFLPDEGDSDNKTVPLNSYTEIFEKQFPHYLAIGMSYDEYWHGDNQLVRAYREAEKIKFDRLNFQLWLQGRYVYDAVCAAYPLLNPMSKQKEAIPYNEKPYEFNNGKKQEEISEKEKERQEMLAEKTRIEKMLINASAAWRKKSGENNG